MDILLFLSFITLILMIISMILLFRNLGDNISIYFFASMGILFIISGSLFHNSSYVKLLTNKQRIEQQSFYSNRHKGNIENQKKYIPVLKTKIEYNNDLIITYENLIEKLEGLNEK